jgi:glycosyltransferase involved in cell wall biosynthesis
VREVILHVGKVAGISGSEAHLLTLLPGLRERGWDARFCLLHEDEQGAWEFAGRLVDAGVPLEGIRLHRDADPPAFGRVLRTVRRLRPAVLHTHLVHADAYGLPAGKLARVPVLASTKHGFNPFREGRVFALGDRALARLADLHIAISAGLARYLAETEGFDLASFEVVHYGIDAGPEPPPPPAEPRLLCVGRLIPIKGHELLLRAVAEARRAVPELQLEVAGDGPLREALATLATQLAVDGSVTFAGRLSPIGPAYERAAVVVVPSLGEGFGMVALEAAERGRAVVASAVGGLPEILDHERTGLLVPPGDSSALAAAIVELMRAPERVAGLGRAARQRAVKEFSLDRCADRIDALYRAALARRAKKRSTAAPASSARTKSHGTR